MRRLEARGGIGRPSTYLQLQDDHFSELTKHNLELLVAAQFNPFGVRFGVRRGEYLANPSWLRALYSPHFARIGTMDISLIIKQCEDYLFSARNFSTRERTLYYHLLRHTHLEGRPSGLFAILPLANGIGISESSVREDIRALHERGCIRIEDRSRNGHLVRVLLPAEIPGVVPTITQATEVDLETLDFSLIVAS